MRIIKLEADGRISRSAKRLITLVVMGALALTSVVSVAALSKKVCITDGERTVTVLTVSKDTHQILEQAGVLLQPHDTVVRSEENKDCIDLTVKRAFQVTLHADGISRTLVLSDGTVKDAIEEANIKVHEDDIVRPDWNTPLVSGMKVEVVRQYHVQLRDGNQEPVDILLPEGRIEESLKYVGRDLGQQDVLNVDQHTLVQPSMRLEIDRVAFTETTLTEQIPSNTIITLSDAIYEGETKFHEGEPGQREVVHIKKMVNGMIVEDKVKESRVLKKAVPSTKTIGIKPKTAMVAKNGNTLSKGYSRDNKDGTIMDHHGNMIRYSSVLRGTATAYTAESSGTVTSTGKKVQVGYVAVNPKIIPYGTKLYIASPDGSYVYGYAIAADTGGAMMEGKALVDLYYDTLQECFSFGRRTVSVYILE